MLTTVNFLYGNVFYIVRSGKLAWLLLVQPSAFFRNQDGGLRYLKFRPIFNFWSRWHRGSCNTSLNFMGFSRMGSPFLELFFGYGVNVKVKSEVKGQSWPYITKNHLYSLIICGSLHTYSTIYANSDIYVYIKEIKHMWTWIYVSGIPICKYL